MDDDAEELDLTAYPDALAAYRTAHELARRDVQDVPIRHPGDPDPARLLATMKKRVRLLELDPAAEARVWTAIAWGEGDGRAGDPPRW